MNEIYIHRFEYNICPEIDKFYLQDKNIKAIDICSISESDTSD